MPFALPQTDADFDTLNRSFADVTLVERLRALVEMADRDTGGTTGRGRIVFTTSFGLEDQAITHAVFGNDLPIEVVTLDTGRFFEETYALWARTEARYGRRIRPFYPERRQVEELVSANGINGFYDSVAARKACCFVRKVEPLGRALDGASVWITGIRAEQNASRQTMAFLERDADRELLKANPMLDWDQARLDAYVAKHAVDTNPLHLRGYPSIGCEPCTRAVEPGEDPRAGRWWWENEGGGAGGECGLHVGPDGKLVRAPKAATPTGTLVD